MNTMKKLFTLTLISLSFFAKADNWTQKTDFGGVGRFMPVFFAVNNLGYIGCGWDSMYHYLEDFWAYDPVNNSWTQKADFGGGKRSGTASFSIGSKGYAGMGGDSAGTLYIDFWEYDPALNFWIQKADFGGSISFNSVAFSIASKGYACADFGSSGFINDLWEFDPLTNTWTLVPVPSFVNIGSFGLAIGNKGYTGLGKDSTGVMLQSFFEFNPQNYSWTQKANFPPGQRDGVACFSINNKGYVGSGFYQGNVFNDLWEYDPALNQWIQKANLPSFSRNLAASFTLNNKGYFGVGKNWTGLPLVTTYNDFWEYTPDGSTSVNEYSASNLQFTISPNPAKDFIVINYPLYNEDKINLSITDMQGKKIYESQLSQSAISVKNFSKGIYLVELNNGKQKTVKRIVKE